MRFFLALSGRESSLALTFCESCAHLDITHPSIHMTQRFVIQGCQVQGFLLPHTHLPTNTGNSNGHQDGPFIHEHIFMESLERWFLDIRIHKGSRFTENAILELDVQTHYFQYLHFLYKGVSKGLVGSEAIQFLRSNSSQDNYERTISTTYSV